MRPDPGVRQVRRGLADPGLLLPRRRACQSALDLLKNFGALQVCNPTLQGFELTPNARAQAVPDATGREDLAAALTRRLLLAAAAGLGCNRLALGDSATRLAARAVAAAAKGSGRALPASLQHFDARRAPAITHGS